jgi:hypothetical protein
MPSAPPSSEPGGGFVPSAPSSQPSSSAPSARPPVAVGIAPPPGLSPGIPIPPFAQQQRPQRAEPKPSAAQQTIKVEIGEEIHAERSLWKRRVAMGAAAGVLIGGVIGFVGGGAKEKGDRARAGARGAAALEADVKGTVEKLKDLDAKVSDALEKILKQKKYPDELSQALAGLTIPFEVTNLDRKDVGFMGANVQKNVLAFTIGVEKANKSREVLANMVGAKSIQDSVKKMWAEETAPMVNFSVVFRAEGKQVVGELVPNVTPFAFKSDYADNYKIMKGGEKPAKRYAKGELPGNELQAVPVDPKTTPNPEAMAGLGQIIKRLGDLHQELNGNRDNPQNELPGLVKQAEDLSNELHKAALTTLTAQEIDELQKKPKR